MNKITQWVFTGAESCGKTTLSTWLAKQYNWPWVAEYARTYLEDPAHAHLQELMHQFPRAEFEAVAQGQRAVQEKEGYFKAAAPAVYDTDLLTLYIWGIDKYGHAEKDWLITPKNTGYLLCSPTNAATQDPLRVDSHRREELHHKYAELLQALGLPYWEIDGDSWEEKRAQIKRVVELNGRY